MSWCVIKQCIAFPWVLEPAQITSATATLPDVREREQTETKWISYKQAHNWISVIQSNIMKFIK